VLKTLAGLVVELRAVGIPVSPTEHIDAAAALRFIDLLDRDAVKAALGTTLVKNAEHADAFSTAFDLYFADRRRDAMVDPSDVDDQLTAAMIGGAGAGPGAAADDADVRELLYRALREQDEPLLRALAGLIVQRHAGIEPGRRVAGTYYLFKALRWIDLESLLGRLREELAAGESFVDTRLAGVEAAARVDAFRAEVEFEIRARMVADRGAADVARTAALHWTSATPCAVPCQPAVCRSSWCSASRIRRVRSSS